MKTGIKIIILSIAAYVLQLHWVQAQNLGLYNAQGKLVHKFKQGRSIDFRIDFEKLYPDRRDSILETRVYGLIDSIYDDRILLIENEIIVYFTEKESYLVEEEYEFTDLNIHFNDIKAISYTPAGQAVGTALITIGAAAVLVSPLLGINPSSGYASDRFLIVAGLGLGSAVVGAGLYWAYNQKPFKIKPFRGPDYFKRYQDGRISIIESRP